MNVKEFTKSLIHKIGGGGDNREQIKKLGGYTGDEVRAYGEVCRQSGRHQEAVDTYYNIKRHRKKYLGMTEDRCEKLRVQVKESMCDFEKKVGMSVSDFGKKL